MKYNDCTVKGVFKNYNHGWFVVVELGTIIKPRLAAMDRVTLEKRKEVEYEV